MTPHTDHPRRVLVAGATGAVGRRLVPMLVAAGHEVHGLARSDRSAGVVAALGAAPVPGDALDREAVMRAVRATRPHVVVIQLTAIPSRGVRPRRMGEDMAATNRLRREATRHLVDAARTYGAERVVAQSIAFAYAPVGGWVRPESAALDTGADGDWGDVVRAVATLEHLVLASGGPVGVVLRYGGFYGPGTVMAPDGPVAELARRRRLPLVGEATGVSSFIHVDDAAAAAVAAVSRGAGVYNIVDLDPAPAHDWIPAYAEALGAPPPRRVPAWLVRLLAGPHAVEAMLHGRGASADRALAELGWRPSRASWRDGFRELAAAPAARTAPVPVPA